MIIHHQNNVAAFKGNQVYYTLTPFRLASWQASKTTAAAANELIEQARSIGRFTFTRVFGRIN